MKDLKIIYLLLVFSNSTWANMDSLTKGVAVDDENIDHLATTSWEYAKSSTTQQKFEDGFALAFFKKSNNLYSLSGKPALYLTNFDTREVLGNWPLTRWPHATHVKEVQERIDGFGLKRDGLNVSQSGIGCLAESPLRFGDFDKDNKNEIILILSSDLVVFSLDEKDTVFSINFEVEDWESMESTREHHHDEIAGYLEYPNAPQYDSSMAHVSGGLNVHVAGYRGYAKVYVSDFDDNGQMDILVWRKLYESKMQNDPQRGFTVIRNEWLHFQKSSSAETQGQYLPQETAESTIQGWLTAKNQTWQSGSPSKSECAGQEGQLIPEMHDPLLNDPDVLK
jgi:hypothetical protein